MKTSQFITPRPQVKQHAKIVSLIFLVLYDYAILSNVLQKLMKHYKFRMSVLILNELKHVKCIQPG